MSDNVVIKKINRTKFYNEVKKGFYNGKLSQTQVEGIEAILNEWQDRKLTDLRWLAYILATVFHECAGTFQPIKEYGKGKGKKYGKPSANGKIHYGRGWVQLTWDYNYKKMGELLGIDLYNDPDLALDCKIATDILYEGMIRGSFAGRKLEDYFKPKIVLSHDQAEKMWLNARRIINGMDKAELIAKYAKRFYSILLTS